MWVEISPFFFIFKVGFHFKIYSKIEAIKRNEDNLELLPSDYSEENVDDSLENTYSEQSDYSHEPFKRNRAVSGFKNAKVQYLKFI